MADQSPHILYFARMVPAYRLPVLNRLNEALDGRLVVCSGEPPGKSSILQATDQQPVDYEHIPLANHWLHGESIHFQNYSSVFRKYPRPAVVLAEESPRSVSLPFLLRKARKVGAGRVLWGIFYSFHRPFSASHPLQKYRLRMANSVEACACYTKGVRDILHDHVDNDKLFVAQNTMETDILFKQRSILESEGIINVRKRLGIDESHKVLIFIGQLVPRKGTREVIDLFETIRRSQPATLLVMRAGPERENMEEYARELGVSGVKFLGPISRLEDSSPYIFASDVVVIPGYVGLVVNHSLCLGVPIVTQKAPANIPYHAPEVESIVDGMNGFITERSPDALLEGVQKVLQERDLFSRRSIAYAEKHITIQVMINGLVDAISWAENQSSATR
ncbi:MAG: glycosyltransferase [Rhodothermales bacterium]|nr:glycosyltransferase [Rhodothermales bacterium]